MVLNEKKISKTENIWIKNVWKQVKIYLLHGQHLFEFSFIFIFEIYLFEFDDFAFVTCNYRVHVYAEYSSIWKKISDSFTLVKT